MFEREIQTITLVVNAIAFLLQAIVLLINSFRTDVLEYYTPNPIESELTHLLSSIIGILALSNGLLCFCGLLLSRLTRNLLLAWMSVIAFGVLFIAILGNKDSLTHSGRYALIGEWGLLLVLNLGAILLNVEFTDRFGRAPVINNPTLHINSPLLVQLEDEGKEDKEEPEEDKGSKTRLLKLAVGFKGLIGAGCLALVIRLPFSLAVPHFVAEVTGAMITDNIHLAITNILGLLIAGTVDSLLDFWTVFIFGLAQNRIIRSLRVRLLRNVLDQEVAFFDVTNSGDITSRLTSDCTAMSSDLTWCFRWTLEAIVRISGIMVYMIVRDWRLALLVTGALPICAVASFLYGRFLKMNQEKVQAALASANIVALEAISAVRTVISFGNEMFEGDRYHQRIQKHYKLNVKQQMWQGIYYMLISTFLINTLNQAATLYYGSWLIYHTGMEVTILIAFMLYQGQLTQWALTLLNGFTDLMKSSGAAAKVFEYLDRCSDLHWGTLQPSDCQGAIEFVNVHFAYPSRTDTPVLNGISFQVRPGEVVALVGCSGAGKSTCFHLIEHFYEPIMGQVRMDGEPVQNYDRIWLHSRIGLVGQEPVLFSGSVLGNILYPFAESVETEEGNLTEEMQKTIIQAAKIANAHDFVTALPLGYNTEVGEKGVQLSGGQKQRIAIARAIVQNPRVLLLDEATSALDSESEKVVQEALEKAMQGRTVLVIAHRLSTVARADRILVFHEGKVVQRGTHAELLKQTLELPDFVDYRTMIKQQTGDLV